MKCPICGGNNLQHDTRDIPHTYKNEQTLIKGITGDFCADCGEVILAGDDLVRFGEEISAFSKRINASIVDPGFIVAVRKKLALNQHQAGEIFGGGVNAFSRYESGKALPPVALVKLLKLLDHHPDLFEEIRA